jgi:hypothetical protein
VQVMRFARSRPDRHLWMDSAKRRCKFSTA